MSLAKLLSKINGKSVITVGMVGAAASSLLLGRYSAYTIFGLMAFVAVLTYFSKAQALFSKLLGSFADVPAWPRFVALGVASLVAAHHGGPKAILTMCFLLAAMDGNVFDALY